VTIPANILNQVYHHYRTEDWCIIQLNNQNQLVYANDNAIHVFHLTVLQTDIKAALPLLATETLEDDFFIPFYNHGKKIYDVHFLTDGSQKFIIMVPIDALHQQLQYKQQIAHEQVIEKIRLQYLFSTLETAHTELNQANSAKSFYISALSHEIGNPITAIKGYNQLLEEGAIDASTATQIIGKNADKIQHIISQTLDYDQQHNNINNIKFKPAEMVDDIFNDFKIQAQNKSLFLDNQVATDITVSSNTTKWNQVFTNLISNAIKYTDSGGITICSVVANGLLHLDVIDTGCGMSKSFQTNLFTAWKREQKSQANGNGIGLVISKMLAEQVGADLALHSSDSHGSCFRFSLNYQEHLNTHRILLVDDDPDCLNLFNYYLTQAGHQVITANSIQSLKQQLAKHEFDTLITDLNLSDGQVHHIYSEIRAKLNKIILITANPTAAMSEQLARIGFDLVLSKPLNQEKLVNSVSD
jgi:signal transduction histidine kinase